MSSCVASAHAPASLLGKELAGPNVACCELRNALDPSSKSKGMNGINKNVALCVNAEGKPITLKAAIASSSLDSYMLT